MDKKETAETLEAMGRILRELPAGVVVIDVFVQHLTTKNTLEAEVHLLDGITTLADFYGKPIESSRWPGSQFTEFSIEVNGVKLFMLKKNHERTMSHE